MFNVGGGEIIVILLVALIVLGPTKLPGAARQVGSFLTEVRRMSNQFKSELKDAMPEEMVDLKRDLDDTRRSLRSMSVDERIEAQARERGRAIVAGEEEAGTDEPEVSTAEAAGMFSSANTLGSRVGAPVDEQDEQNDEASPPGEVDGEPDEQSATDDKGSSA
jgi:Tat protein translocase TatB subunit